MFGFNNSGKIAFDREVRREIAYMRDLYGDQALAMSRERVARPRLGRARRLIIEEAIRRLAAEKPTPTS